MQLKRAILEQMGREALKQALDDLGLDSPDRRSVERFFVRSPAFRRQCVVHSA